MVAELQRRRDAFCAGLNDIPGWRCAIPGGAFYAFANVKATGRGSKEIADSLLADAGVACLNGAGFGEFGEGYIRFSYAGFNLEPITRISSGLPMLPVIPTDDLALVRAIASYGAFTFTSKYKSPS